VEGVEKVVNSREIKDAIRSKYSLFHLKIQDLPYYLLSIYVHCCPRTVESIATSVDFIGFFAQNSTPSKPGFTAESRRSLSRSTRLTALSLPKGEIFSAPIGPSPRRNGFVRAGGRRRLEQKLRPFGNKIEPFYGYGTYCQPSIIEQKLFCLSVSPDKQKIISLRSRRLCGENIILGKHDLFL